MELLNSTAVIEAVERGETLVITRNGLAVAELRTREEAHHTPTIEVLRAFRDLPRVSYDEMRAESESLLW